MPSGNLYEQLPPPGEQEVCEPLVTACDVQWERIVSTGQATPAGQWYDQADGEFVLLLAGWATLRFEHETAARALGPGDWVWIPPRVRHRLDATSRDPAAVWLAAFVPAERG